jgi:gliding motility-associated-like protein
MVIASQVQASFNENVISGDAPLSVDFLNTSLQAASYVWRFDDGTTLSSEDMTHLFEQPGDYPVWLIATDANGCDDSLMHIIHVEAAGYMYAPTAFSPNGDGLNDEFRIIGNGIVSMEAQIFSRWGNPICTIADLHSGWDGTERLGAPCPAGAYVYIVHAEFVDGHRQDMHGFINLIR